MAQTSSALKAWDGPYTPIPVHYTPGRFQHCCEVSHALLVARPGPAQGKVILIQSNGDRRLWDPAAPNSIGVESFCDMIPPAENMFCCAHSADGDGNLVFVGGARHKSPQNNPPCTPQPKYSFVYEADAGCWSPNYPLITPNPPPPDPNNPNQVHPNFGNPGYYYPSSVRLPDGRVLTLGGGSDPLDPNLCGDQNSPFYVDGWQVLDRSLSTPGWIGSVTGQGVSWFDGLPGTFARGGTSVPYDFTFYPLTAVIRSSLAAGAQG